MIVVSQSNGAKWLATNCETVIPTGGAKNMSPAEVAQALAYCDELSRRLDTFLAISNHDKDYFESVCEFERYEEHPRIASADRPAAPKREAKRGVVYLIKGNNSYKIGRSTRFEHREHYFMTKLPFPIEVIHVINTSDNVSVERFWHNRFAPLRIRGEWFELGEIEVAEFKQHAEM
jgi:hypothetical protein